MKPQGSILFFALVVTFSVHAVPGIVSSPVLDLIREAQRDYQIDLQEVQRMIDAAGPQPSREDVQHLADLFQTVPHTLWTKPYQVRTMTAKSREALRRFLSKQPDNVLGDTLATTVRICPLLPLAKGMPHGVDLMVAIEPPLPLVPQRLRVQSDQLKVTGNTAEAEVMFKDFIIRFNNPSGIVPGKDYFTGMQVWQGKDPFFNLVSSSSASKFRFEKYKIVNGKVVELNVTWTLHLYALGDVAPGYIIYKAPVDNSQEAPVVDGKT